MSSASSTAAGSVVERVRIEKSAYRSFAVTVRPESPELRRRSETSSARRRTSSCSRSRSVRSRAKVSSAETETGSSSRSRSRGSIPRARSRSIGPTVPGRSERSSASPSAASAPIVSTPALPQSLLGARADAREQTDGERSEEARLGSRRDDGDAAGLAAIGRDLADDLRRTDAERARQARLRAHRGLDRRRDCARAREVGRDRAEIEVALVDSRALDPRDDLADRVPHDARVLPVERVSSAGGRRRSGSAGAPRPRSSPSGCRTSAPRSSRSRRRRGCAGRRRRRAACRAAPGSRAPRRRRRTRRGRGARGSSRQQSYCCLVIATPALPPPAIEQPAAHQVSYGLVTGRAARGTTQVIVHANGKRLASRQLEGRRFTLRVTLPRGDVTVRVTTIARNGQRSSAHVHDVFGLPAGIAPSRRRRPAWIAASSES